MNSGITVFPVKKKLGPNDARAKGKSVTHQTAMQFALEKAVERLAAVERQCDGLARQDKQKDIEINQLKLRVARLEAVANRGQDE